MNFKKLMRKFENKRSENVKVAIPTMGNNGMDEYVSEHFGRAPTFTLVDLDTNKVRVIPNTSEHLGGTGYPPEILANAGGRSDTLPWSRAESHQYV
jgi:hypothetical protein